MGYRVHGSWFRVDTEMGVESGDRCEAHTRLYHSTQGSRTYIESNRKRRSRSVDDPPEAKNRSFSNTGGNLQVGRCVVMFKQIDAFGHVPHPN